MRYIVGGKDYSTRFIKEAVEKAIFDGAIDSNEDAPYEGARAYGISVETVHGTIVGASNGGSYSSITITPRLNKDGTAFVSE